MSLVNFATLVTDLDGEVLEAGGKKLIGKGYAPLIVGRMYEILNPPAAPCAA